MKKICFILFIGFLVAMVSCTDPFAQPEVDEECLFAGAKQNCWGFGWSPVRREGNKWVNLLGYDSLKIDPNDVFILNLQKDTMPLSLSDHAGWLVLAMNPFDEMNCFSQCLLDSAFSRYYFVHYGYNDWDTIETHYPAQINYERWTEVYYNGKPAITADTVRHASYYCEKTN